MSEEEKKAIEYIKEFKNEVFEGVGNKSIMVKNIDILLNLIEKQQKETEKLKFNNHMVGKWNEYLDKECISKDKIREKIKEVDKEYKEIQERQIEMSTFMKIEEKRKNKKDILEELLEEE